RVQYPGAIYHLMNRGDRREPIFHNDKDRLLFLDTLAEACQKTDWQIHAWCLMNNHFHLVSEIPRANLVEGMQWFLGVYINRFNEGQLHRILTEFLDYYRRARPHKSLADDSPDGRGVEDEVRKKIVALPVLGGLHHRYTRKAA